MAKVKCSCNIITSSSEKTIRQCLDSIIDAGCFYEIVIAIDNRTNQETINLLQEYQSPIPIKMFFFQWGKDGFSGPRNATLRESTGEYIFWLDTDEMVDKSVCHIINQASKEAYYLVQRSYLPEGNFLDVPQIRLFPNINGVKWELPIHEQVFFSLQKKKIPMINTDCLIYHTGYDDKDKIKERHIRNFGYLSNFVKNYPKVDDKMKYIQERYNESFTYLNGNNLLGSLGWVQIVIALIPLIVTGVQMGLSYKQAVDYASNQAKLQRALIDSEINQLAEGMHVQYPNISYDDWRHAIKMSMDSYVPPINNGEPPPTPTPTPTKYNYLWYILIGLGIIGGLRK